MNIQSRCLICSVMLMALAGAQQVPANLLKGLASEEFKERESSQAELEKWVEQTGESALKAVLNVYQNHDDPEVRERCMRLLKKQSEADYLKGGGQGYLGVQMWEEIINIPGDEKPRACISITRFIGSGGPAESAGLKVGDTITSLDGKKWYERGAIDDFTSTIATYKPGKKVVFIVRRPGQNDLIEIPVVLGRRPVENLGSMNYEDIERIDKEAKDRHFEEWLKKLMPAS